MLDEIDEDVALDPIAKPHLRNSHYTASSNRTSAAFSLARTARSSMVGTSESEPFSEVASPTPANGQRVCLQARRHSIEAEVGDWSRPSIDSDAGRPSFDSVRDSPVKIRPEYRQHWQERQQKLEQKQSSTSSLFTYSSINSSPCPRPPRRKLLMLTGNKLPRAPLKQPVFASAASSTISKPAVTTQSPESGRVRRLKASWETKFSPKKGADASGTRMIPCRTLWIGKCLCFWGLTSDFAVR